MNRKLLIAWLVVFVAWMFGSFLIHGTLLYNDYAQHPGVFRPESEAQRLFHRIPRAAQPGQHLGLDGLAHLPRGLLRSERRRGLVAGAEG